MTRPAPLDLNLAVNGPAPVTRAPRTTLNIPSFIVVPLLAGFLLMLALGSAHNETLSMCPANTLCGDPTSPVPAFGYFTCVTASAFLYLLLSPLRALARRRSA